MELSDFGTKLSSHSGILQLMDDIARPLGEGVRVRPLGGGNPARVAPVEQAYRRQMERTRPLSVAPQGDHDTGGVERKAGCRDL